MVLKCDNCGEKAYASRYKDSYLSFCRACGCWRDLEKTGQYSKEKLEEMRDEWPVQGVSYEEVR